MPKLAEVRILSPRVSLPRPLRCICPGWNGTKALDDVLRLARYLKNHNAGGSRLLLLGFADSVGTFDKNSALSENRAKSVRDALIKTGANLDRAAIIAKGYSELLPVACNSNDLGREKNRRVEAYLLDR